MATQFNFTRDASFTPRQPLPLMKGDDFDAGEPIGWELSIPGDDEIDYMLSLRDGARFASSYAY